MLSEETRRVVPSFSTDRTGPFDSSAVEFVRQSAQPLLWLVPFTAATGTYLFANALALSTRKPLLWTSGLLAGGLLFVSLAEAANADWLVRGAEPAAGLVCLRTIRRRRAAHRADRVPAGGGDLIQRRNVRGVVWATRYRAMGCGHRPLDRRRTSDRLGCGLATPGDAASLRVMLLHQTLTLKTTQYHRPAQASALAHSIRAIWWEKADDETDTRSNWDSHHIRGWPPRLGLSRQRPIASGVSRAGCCRQSLSRDSRSVLCCLKTGCGSSLCPV